jgi:transposase
MVYTTRMPGYSTDLRLRVLAAVDSGMARVDVVRIFQVSLATIKRYLKQRRETGELTSRHPTGRPATKGPALATGLAAQLSAFPDATLAAHCERWTEATGMGVSTATMSRAVTRLGWTRKKRRWVPPSGTNSSATPSVTSWPPAPPPTS